jgi:pyruvate,water dikinase
MGDKTASRSPGGETGPGSARFLLRTFKRILGLNTRVLERMAQMDRALGGEYVFDKAFLESAVRDVCGLTHRVAYHLNGMAQEGYVDLYDAFLSVKDALEDILAGGMGPLAGRRTLPFSEIGLEMEPLVGLMSVGLAVLGRRMGLPAPDGLAVTVTGMRDLAGGAREEIREEVLAEIRDGVKALHKRLGGVKLLTLSLVAAGHEGAGRVLAEVWAGTAEEAAKAVLQLAETYAPGSGGGTGADPKASAPVGDLPLAVCLRQGVEAPVRGTLMTLAHDPSLPPAMLAVAHQAGQPADMAGDRYWLSRTAPHIPLRSRIAPKPLDVPLSGGRALDPSLGRSLRGSALLTPRAAGILAELGLAAERALGGPCRVAWALTQGGGLWLTGLEPATREGETGSAGSEEPEASQWSQWEGGDDSNALSAPEDILAQGGQVACGGVGAGPVTLIDDDTQPESVPLGAIGVARAATPGLSRIVPRLGALLAEVGTAASHLATVARENRVPALFGLKGVRSLEPGTMVTVDAFDGAVYRGVAESLLRQSAIQETRVGSEPEFLVLRRLLRHIRPLNLVDPKDCGFDPAHCRTFHDIIHFAHEKAVELLLSIDASGRSGLGSPRRFQGDSPFALGIVDLGGGLSPGESRGKSAGKGDVTLDQVESLPLRAFLEGLMLRNVRREAPARLSLGDIVAGMGRTSQALAEQPGSAGLNLAVAARDYANITLRLGYHFSVVDAVVSERPEHTFVYFRFAGGFADDDRRARRAGLILAVLTRLGFRASRQGDLVVGKRKLLETNEALEVLRFLGALSAYTRQLDVELASEEDVERFSREFLNVVGLDAAGDAASSSDAVAGKADEAAGQGGEYR